MYKLKNITQNYNYYNYISNTREIPIELLWEVTWDDDAVDVVTSLTIIPRAWIGSDSIAHEAEDRMGYWLRGHEGERNNCFSKIQLVGQKYRDKTPLAS